MTESESSASSSSPKLTQFCKLTKSTEDAASTSSLHSTPPHHVPENEGAMDCVSVPQVEQTAPGTKTLSRFEWLKAREAQASAMTQQEEPAEKCKFS
ncbi:hypothetical protein B566_EDAN008273 [Ephemera danica]|nr:hypothetical protein B566_EDAN008273 [Ephemera danica]